MPDLTRRTFLASAAVLGSSVAIAAYPDKPIRLVIPYGGGGIGTVFGTMVTEVLSAQLKTGAYVDYKPGASAAIGSELVAKAPADGYTLLMAVMSSMAVNPAFYTNLRYDPLKDFTPVGAVWNTRNVLFGTEQVRSVKELVALGKKKELSYGSLGVGSMAHLSAEMLLRKAGIKGIHVPYRGQGQIMTELAGGRLDFAFTDPTGIGLAKGGRVNALAVTGKERLGIAREIPTMAEAGYPNIGAESWIAIFAPTGTPPDVVQKLSAALKNGFSPLEIKAKVIATGAEVAPDMSPEFLDKDLRSQLAKWKKFQEETKITIQQ